VLVGSGVDRVGDGNGDGVRGGGVGGKVSVWDGVGVCVASLVDVGSEVGDAV
jgi:hypothetical protein